MTDSYIDLTYWQVAIAAMLVIANGLISLTMGLNLEKSLFISSIRMTFQLFLIGFILHWVFSLNQWYYVLALMIIMTTIAGVTAIDRISTGYKGVVVTSLISIWSSSWFVTIIALFVVIQVKPWYTPQYAIPLLGMILGNILTGVSIGIDRLTSDLKGNRDQIETLLALGATKWEAARAIVSDAIKAGMLPTINMMMVAGIVALPGMMTGQLLAGVQPMSAVKYQIVIIFLIAVATGLGTMSGVLLSFKKLFNNKHQFLYDDLIKK